MYLQIVTVELTSSMPLSRTERVHTAELVRNWLATGVVIRQIDVPDLERRGQRLVSLQAHATLLDPPLDGREACRLGFWRRMNPFMPDTPEHENWNAGWDQTRDWRMWLNT